MKRDLVVRSSPPATWPFCDGLLQAKLPGFGVIEVMFRLVLAFLGGALGFGERLSPKSLENADI